MKIKKNGKTVNLTEEEVNKIINRQKINNFLAEDTIYRKEQSKKTKIKSIINKLRELSNMLGSVGDLPETKLNDVLHKVEQSVGQQIEDLEDAIVKQKENKNKENDKK